MVEANINKNSQELLRKLSTLDEEELSQLVRFHNEKYFVANEPEISDEAFDKLVEALRYINPESKALLEIEHVPKDFIHEKLARVKHDKPMLSLEKCYEQATFEKWAEKVKGGFIAMPKIDGVACSLSYNQNGHLTLGATRGDGNIGENITDNVSGISDLPKILDAETLKKVISDQQKVEIRGEVYLAISRFQSRYANAFANPRNLAAGALKLKDPNLSKSYGLQFLPYDIRGTTLQTEEEKFSLLKKLGFNMMPWKMVSTLDEAFEFFRLLEKERHSFDYEIDGVVFRAQELKEQVRLGETAHHPKFAIAYKFQGESGQTELVAVSWSIARTGVITPVAIVKPVFVSGASITRASLHNLGIFLKMDLHEQSLVEINRRGGVIPNVERVLSKKGEKLSPPTSCPSCQGPVIADGDFLQCAEPEQCREVMVSSLIHFCSVLEIEGLGKKIIARLFDEGIIKKLVDIFRLKKSDLLQVERMGEILATKLIAEIDTHRTISLKTFIEALGIREVGPNVAEILAEHAGNINKIKEMNEEDLKNLSGIGPSIAQSVVAGILKMSKEIDDLLSVLTISETAPQKIVDKNHTFFNKSVVFTGSMAHLDRKAAQKLIKNLGGHTPGAVTKKTDFLVIGDEASALVEDIKKSTKHKEALKLNAEGNMINIISETEFLRLARGYL